ncbi:thiol:disulfide interchange protein DsbC [Campylobacter insulaenigrae]|uniref:thioredoxin fold domain-containing protein n=1 Tax=Campylobacter insulaenigrae TaxID=260714 RepID=UPI000F6EB3A0|nr:thioredoxin fold domain-containing protein [Campylobacter insulaenigrae]MCR6591415.1 thioredoxin fold domain-containing protein [Campylobacter insulaenigrae]MCR6592984.1 thioredoxin fold domain-containing protein [Campylobacter insulaenigrae]VEJ55053.1 thiol:disulfide interchange protein DsbC [Campylobacter insulaenigrae]
MKKSLALLTLASSLFAANNEEIINFFKKNPNLSNANITIASREKIEDSNFEAVMVNFDFSGKNFQEIVFTDGNFITTELIDLKKERFYSQVFQAKLMEKQQAEFSKKALVELQKENMFISLGDKNKPLLYIFSDPECPYCRMHLEKIEDTLKTHQVKFILTPIHDISAFEKSALIYKESKNAKDDAQKIAIMKKYYDKNLKEYNKPSNAEVNEVKNTFEKYSKLGLRAVPTIINAQK